MDKLIITDLKGNILSKFSSQDIVASFSIFNSWKLPQNDSPDLSSYGENFLAVFEDHYDKEHAVKSIEREEFIMPALVMPALVMPDIQEVHQSAA